MKKNSNFAPYLTEFLSHYLPELKNVSENTISSYCDTFRLFLEYCRDNEGLKIEKLSLSDINSDIVERFLEWLETERKNGIATRNQRLAAIHSFVRYIQPQEPSHLLNFQKILDIPIKKTASKPIQHLSKEDVAVILRQPDTDTAKGRRDAMILCLMYDTAARVQEVCDICAGDVRLAHPASIRITGKGRKTRVVPLLPATVQNLKSYMAENHLLSPENNNVPLFTNRDGKKLTRAGIAYILDKYAEEASRFDTSIPKHVAPHVIRHTKAMHIYESGNNLIYVRDFLGHNDVKTTDVYARTSLKMKRDALEKVSDSPVPEMPSWQKNNDTLEWLKSFGKKNK